MFSPYLSGPIQVAVLLVDPLPENVYKNLTLIETPHVLNTSSQMHGWSILKRSTLNFPPTLTDQYRYLEKWKKFHPVYLLQTAIAISKTNRNNQQQQKPIISPCSIRMPTAILGINRDFIYNNNNNMWIITLATKIGNINNNKNSELQYQIQI